MPRPRHNTTALPRNLRSELGIRDTYGDKKRRLNGPASRKERRQNERTQKKSRHAAPPQKKVFQRPQSQAQGDSDDEVDDDSDDMDIDEKPSAPQKKSKSTKETTEKPKSILKKAATKPTPESESESGSELESEIDLNEDDDEDDEEEDEEDEEDEDEESDEDDHEDEDEVDQPSENYVSGSVKSKLAQDDAEIAALEKKLGLKKGGKSKAFEDDGLDDILGDLGGGGDASEDESRKRKREADDWLQAKRQKAKAQQAQASKQEDSEMDSDDDVDLDEQIFGSDDEDAADGSDFDGFDEEPKEKKPKENPYIAPVTKEATAQKYIPPSLRARLDPENESLTRLKRQAQGQLNKLSEANMLSIVAEFEKLYRDYPRQHVTSTLISLLMGLICERAALNDTFLILHAGFISALYKLLGMDFGAEIVQKIVETLDAGGDERGKFEGKEILNLVSLLSQLYNFHVIGSPLMFDYVRLFVQEINEANTELLLKVIRNSGPQLRLDDPSALKDIVLLIQPAVANAGEASLSVRTKFMIDTITDLKNNRSKSAAAAGAGITTEHITKMRKILGSLNNSRVIRASEPINISREDIHNSSKKGKWWLVGASWKEDPLVAAQREMRDAPITQAQAPVQDDESDAEPDFGDLAKAHRMNTDVRRSIFVAIMSANDFQDAHVRLMKLRLKRAQEYEIPRVLLHCAMEEQAHNPYYSLIARRICGDMGRRIKMSFMFALWNIFKRMGERGDMEDDDDDNVDPDDPENGVSMKSVVNLAKMYSYLVADGSLTLSILKNLNFAYLQPKTKTFLEVLIISIMQQSQKSKKKSKKSKTEEPRNEEALMQIFLRVKETPQIAKGLIYFVRKVVAKSDIVSEEDQKLVRWGCNVAADALKAVAD